MESDSPRHTAHETQAAYDARSAYVLPETTFLAAIGCLDLLTTVFWVATGRAMEANPLMAAVLHATGRWGFAGGKALFLAVPLTIAELARRRHPRFVRNALRVCIFFYVCAYAISWLRFNAG